MKTIKILLAMILLAVFVLGVAVTVSGAYSSLTEQRINLAMMMKGVLTMGLPIGFVFAVSRLRSNWKPRT